MRALRSSRGLLRRFSSAAEVPKAIDLARYPLHEDCQPLLERCQAEVSQQGYCHLPGFLRADAVEELLGEVKSLEANCGFRSHEAHNVFLDRSDEVKEQLTGMESATSRGELLREKEFSSSKVLIAMDDMRPLSPLLAVYRWDPLRKFLQDVFRLPQLHHSADPLGGAYYNIFDGDFGDALGWHFDRSNFSMNLILQTSSGGDFQYVPDSKPAISQLRTWAEAEQHIQGRIKTPELYPGSLYLFAGSRSLHRVTPVTAGQRVNAIFTYVEDEGARLNEYTLRTFFGRLGPRS